jgi:hypothetical protein
MIRISRATTILSAAALLILNLAIPASADDEPSGSAVNVSDVSSANIPLPRSRPAFVRKRVASEWPTARPAPRQVAWFFGPYRPVVAAHWPVLMLGVGF